MLHLFNQRNTETQSILWTPTLGTCTGMPISKQIILVVFEIILAAENTLCKRYLVYLVFHKHLKLSNDFFLSMWKYFWGTGNTFFSPFTSFLHKKNFANYKGGGCCLTAYHYKVGAYLSCTPDSSVTVPGSFIWKSINTFLTQRYTHNRFASKPGKKIFLINGK